MNVVRDRICRQCGKVFPGGPRAWYCPECRALREKECNRRHRQRLRAGKTDKIGETIRKCKVCGEPFIIRSARQIYCEKCAPDAVKQVDRVQSRGWFQRSIEKYGDEYRIKRNIAKRAAPKHCIICGNVIVNGTGGKNTCSPTCKTILAGYWQAKADYKRGKRMSLPTLEQWIKKRADKLP